MTVLATASSQLFPGSGNTGPFTWTWRFLANTDISVFKLAGGVITLLAVGVDYAIAGAGSYQGGSIITVDAVEVGESLYVKRNTGLLQRLDLRNQGDFFPDSYEDALDFLCMMIQDQQRALAEAEATIAEVAATIAGTAAGVGLLYIASAAEGPIVLPASGNVRVAKAVGDESADALNIIPGTPGQTIEGLEQYRDGLTGAGESVFLVFNEADNAWYKF